ncbi:Spo11/DNA topoisomerase VI subunit A, partial [Schizophyllum fasciatum]
AQYKQLAYPRKSATGSARPFAQLFRVMDMVHEAVTDDIPVTKRDMYYKDVALFGTQRVVDNLVDDLAATFNVERSNLNVRATSKGLICGSSLLIRLRSGEVLQPTDTDGTLIPVGEDIQSFSLVRPISWVLVVEKDAIFQALCRLQVVKHEGIDGAGLLITASPFYLQYLPLMDLQGKGYPDLATRHLVKTLSDCLSEVPILALVDADAYGLDILSVYKNGSRSLQHEAGKLAADRIQWIGVRGSELSGLGVSTDHLLPISQQDEKMALAMLRRPKIPAEWRRELSRMLFTRRKAEIEVLSYAQTSCVYEYLGNLETTRHLDADPLSHLGNQMHSVSHSQTTQCASASHPLLRYVIRKIQAAL